MFSARTPCDYKPPHWKNLPQREQSGLAHPGYSRSPLASIQPNSSFSCSEPHLAHLETPKKLKPKKSAASIVRRAAAYMRSPPTRSKSSCRANDGNAQKTPKNKRITLPSDDDSATRLVLPRDDVSFSASAFFRRVDAVSAGAARTIDQPPLARRSSRQMLTDASRKSSLRKIQSIAALSREGTTRYVVEPPLPPLSLLPALSLQPGPVNYKMSDQTLPQHLPLVKTFDSLAELQAMSAELTELPLLDSPPPAPPRTRPAAPRDPLAQLMAVAEELRFLEHLDSDDPLPFSSLLPPSLLSFLEVGCLIETPFKTPCISRRIVEMEVFANPFNGADVPSIVVTQPDDATGTLSHNSTIVFAPSTGLLCPPPTNSRGRVDAAPPALLPSSASRDTAVFYAPFLNNLAHCDCEHCVRAFEPDNPWDPLSLLEDLPLISPSLSPPRAATVQRVAVDVPIATEPEPRVLRRKSTLLQRVLSGRRAEPPPAAPVPSPPDLQPPRRSLFRMSFSKKGAGKMKGKLSKESIGMPMMLEPGLFPAVTMEPPLGGPWEQC
ncbi:hypothetical protein FA95DRAFT_1555216 [Auriscalpium vulgare]|uniref:Uncharacterized protein n=1 Tax=Auriscalpium vulgare TaxID=40419 RepID=A0ACB8S2W7_9AGAM|nr:hypothetical protein FA95DRAFT_1555216 [Auriscalpium vulgare]